MLFVFNAWLQFHCIGEHRAGADKRPPTLSNCSCCFLTSPFLTRKKYGQNICVCFTLGGSTDVTRITPGSVPAEFTVISCTTFLLQRLDLHRYTEPGTWRWAGKRRDWGDLIDIVCFKPICFCWYTNTWRHAHNDFHADIHVHIHVHTIEAVPVTRDVLLLVLRLATV